VAQVAAIEVSGRRPGAGAAAVLVAVSVWGAAAVITRVVDQVNGLVLAFHRLWIGAVVTLVAFYLSGRRLTWATLRRSIPGGLAFAADIVLFFSALRHTTVANATVVGALQPALVMLVAGPMFGEPVTAGIIGWSIAAIIGVAVVVYGSSGAPVWSIGGDLLAVGALFAWTLYFIASKRVRRDVPPFDYLAAMLVIATVVVAPLALIFGGALDPGGIDSWAWIVLLAVGSGGVGHLLINWAHDHVELTVMSLLTLAVPVFAVASAAIFLDESVTWVQVFGMLIVLGALSVVAVRAARTEPAPTPPLQSEAL
jgi:drug/metabolite transporter (DMT)-like permease